MVDLRREEAFKEFLDLTAELMREHPGIRDLYGWQDVLETWLPLVGSSIKKVTVRVPEETNPQPPVLDVQWCHQYSVECPACDGHGEYNDGADCGACSTSGEVFRKLLFTFQWNPLAEDYQPPEFTVPVFGPLGDFDFGFDS